MNQFIYTTYEQIKTHVTCFTGRYTDTYPIPALQFVIGNSDQIITIREKILIGLKKGDSSGLNTGLSWLKFIFSPILLQLLSSNYHMHCTEAPEISCTWLGEIYSCSSLTFLPGPAWVLLSKIHKLFFSFTPSPPLEGGAMWGHLLKTSTDV